MGLLLIKPLTVDNILGIAPTWFLPAVLVYSDCYKKVAKADGLKQQECIVL